jgi:hypothetical protein
MLNPCVVDENVEAAKTADKLTNGLTGGLRLGDVKGEGYDVARSNKVKLYLRSPSLCGCFLAV